MENTTTSLTFYSESNLWGILSYIIGGHDSILKFFIRHDTHHNYSWFLFQSKASVCHNSIDEYQH